MQHKTPKIVLVIFTKHPFYLKIKKYIFSGEGIILLVIELIAATSYGSKPKLTTNSTWKKEVLTKEIFPGKMV